MRQNMNIKRIIALLIRHLYLYQRSLPRIMDVLYWPIVDILLWGFLSAYLTTLNLSGLNVVTVLLGAVIFWNLLNQAQKAVSIAFLEDVWEKNLLNIFVTPLKVSEFLASTFLLGVFRIALVVCVMGVFSFILYAFNLLVIGFSLIPFIASLLVFGWALGLFTTGLILRYGTAAQILAFGFITVIQPFSAVFYPLSALPPAAQIIAYTLPTTYVFEGMRMLIASGAFSWKLFSLSLLTNTIACAASVWYFYFTFRHAKKRGALMKLD